MRQGYPHDVMKVIPTSYLRIGTYIDTLVSILSNCKKNFFPSMQETKTKLVVPSMEGKKMFSMKLGLTKSIWTQRTKDRECPQHATDFVLLFSLRPVVSIAMAICRYFGALLPLLYSAKGATGRFHSLPSPGA
jgi:hypothetical protein